LKALYQFIHGGGQTQSPHTHNHSTAQHLHGMDHGSQMMRVLGFIHNFAGNTEWMSDYRNIPLIPTSPRVVITTVVVLAIAAIAHLYLFPASIIGSASLVIGIIAALHLTLLIAGGLAVSLFVRHQRNTARNLVINAIPWKGTEHVLDVGCGTGLMVNGCAQKLTTGEAIGIDPWQESISGTSSVLMKNARAEGVADKVSFQEMDARHLTFDDAQFNVVVSSLALHHIGTERQDREQAVSQMIRVLAPGGYLSLVDINPMIDIAESVIAQAGLETIKREQTHFFRVITAHKST
jgi:arsenite methyltransferase